MNEITPFNYSDLSATEAAELQAVTARIKARMARTIADIIETGRDLIAVKSRLEHGQFGRWLDSEFGMTPRTARLFMQAAIWAKGKSEIVSVLTPATVYLLSAPSTPEAAQRQVLDDLEAGKLVNHREAREVVQEIKHQEREAKKKETRAEQKQRKAYEEQCRRKEEEERQRIETAAMAVAREVANILVNKLSDEEINKLDDAFIDVNVTFFHLRKAIIDAHQSHSDNVTLFPRKPWGLKS